MVDVQERLVEVCQVEVVLCFIIFSEGFIFWGREFTEWSQVGVHIRYVEPMRLVKIAISDKRRDREKKKFWLKYILIPKGYSTAKILIQSPSHNAVMTSRAPPTVQ